MKSVEGSVEAREITVEFDAPETLEAIKATLAEIGYPLAEGFEDA
ncbi:MAG: hypothetical protein ACE5OR_13495 [bacterium]